MPTIRLSIILTFIVSLSFAEPTPGSHGTVVATEDGGSYTYVQLDINGDKVWFAAPAVELKIGTTVTIPAGMPMKDFHSKTLDRTFDLVYFVDSITPKNASPTTATDLPPGHPPLSAVASPAPASFDFSGMEKPEGAKTIAEIHQDSAALAGTTVVVHGIAVKVSNGIMGKNWIHLQDGTGDSGRNDLTVTSTDTVKVGATITASGTLATNLDFGYGYTYAVLLEDAAIESK
jgi:hypothetical protein